MRRKNYQFRVPHGHHPCTALKILVIAEVGKMIYMMRGAVAWGLAVPGRGFEGKVVAGFTKPGRVALQTMGHATLDPHPSK